MTGFFNNKLIIIVATVLLMSFVTPQIASASVPTFETNPVIVGSVKVSALQNIITALSTGASLSQALLEWAFKLAAEQLKRQLLNMIVDQIVNYIQGGGQPRFITDWPGFFKDAIDQVGGKFLQQLGLGQLCSAFGPKLYAGFIPIPQFTTRTSCTMSQVGANLSNFLKDFRQGGWIAWNQMVLNPQNNIYGAYYMAWNELEIEKSAAQKAAEAEAQAGRGFLSVKKCLETTVSPEDQSVVCTKSTIVTPGAVLGDLATKAVGSDIDYIVNAQDFAAYVSAITNAVLNRLFAEGVGLLGMALSGGGGRGGTNISPTSASAQQCASLFGSAAYNDCLTAVQSGTDITQFQKNYILKILSNDLSVQNQILAVKQNSLVALNQSLDTINQATSTLTLGIAACTNLASKASQVKNGITVITNDIAKIQADIIALQQKSQAVQAATTLSQISQLYNQIAGIVNPAFDQQTLMAAQQENVQIQQSLSLYQQQLAACQSQTQLQQQQQSPLQSSSTGG